MHPPPPPGGFRQSERSLVQEVAINDNFAKLTEALYVSEQSARQAVEMRSKVQRELAAKEKEKKDRELRELAIKARMDRLGGGAAPPSLAARESASTLPGPPPRYAVLFSLCPPPPPSLRQTVDFVPRYGVVA
jgi:hypothetical protein